MRGKKNGPTAMRVSAVTIVWNIVLSAFKLIAGIIAHSSAMVSDAVHSASDVLSTLIVIVGIKAAGKESDAEHPYGHERMECVAAIVLAAILCATGIGIGYAGVASVFSGNIGAIEAPGALALAAAVISIVVKEVMYWYTRAAAKRLESGALMADAWHHRSDALSSIGSFIGILGARMGLAVLDPIASLVICLFIIKAAYSIFMDAIEKMTDKSCDQAFVDELKRVVCQQGGVLGVDQIKTRLFGDKVYVDVEIRADATETLEVAHEIAQRAHNAIEAQYPKVKHCMVHVNPCDPSKAAVRG